MAKEVEDQPLDIWHKICKWLDYNRFAVAGIVLAVIASAWLVGCQPMTLSITRPGEKVDVAMLEQEIEQVQRSMDSRAATIVKMQAGYNSDVILYNQAIERAEADLERQVELRKQIVDVVGGLATALATGGLTAPQAVGSVVTLLGLFGTAGFGLDNIRKGRKIKAQKEAA